MPGYMMHLCEGCCILNQILRSDSKVPDTILSKLLSAHAASPDFANEFLLGTVIPDAVSDKSLTHFRPKWQDDLITKYPDIPLLISSHTPESLTAADLGILAHLHMDALYVENFWPKYFIFEDAQNKPICVSDDIDHVRMRGLSMQPQDTLIPLTVFFSDRYFYGDYNITNPLFQRDFAPTIPKIVPIYLTIDECNAFSYERLSEDLSHFIDSEPPADGGNTNVFSYDDLRDFITICADTFLHLY